MRDALTVLVHAVQLKIDKKQEITFKMEVILKPIITCPNCEHQKEETITEDSYQFIYEGES